MTNKKYFYVLLGALIIIIALILGIAFQGNAILEKKSHQLTEIKTEIGAVELQQAALLQAKKDIERYTKLEETLKSIVPQDKDQAKTVREIVQIANNNNIPINSVSFENSTLGTPQTKASGAKPTTPTTDISQVKPVEGIAGVYTLPIKIESSKEVNYPDFLKFLEALEKNRRTAHVDSIAVTPDKQGKTLNFNLTLNAYVKP